MALRTPPSWLQAGSYPAESDRLTTQALWNTTGVIGQSSMRVTANSPAGMTVLIAQGWAAIIGTTQANMGSYVAYNDAAVTATISTADPTNPRIDRIVATVNDAYYTGSSNNVVYTVVAGTPAVTPVAPVTPANSISLALVDVAAGATSITNANITDTRVFASIPSALLNNPVIQSPEERTTISATAATGTINFDALTQGILYYTTNASANFTLNIRGDSTTSLNSVLAVGDSITVVFMNTNGATPYYPTAYQIDGSAISPKWQAGTAPSAGNANSIDAYTLTIMKTATTPTYTILASQTKFA